MRRQYALIIIFSLLTLFVSCTGLKEQEDPMIYSVTSLNVKPVDVTNESLELAFVADLECGSKVSGESSFVYSLNTNFTSSTPLPADEGFTAETLLNAYGETYYVKAVFSNGRNSIESEAVSFQLLPFDEYVSLTAPEPKSISDNSASFVSIVSAAQGVSLDKYGFELSEGKEPFSPASSIESTSTNGEIAGEFKTLVPGGTYYVRSFASEGENTAYSNVVEFKTEAVLPTLALPKVSDILFDSVKAESEVLSDGGDEISEQGFVFGLSQNPTLDNSTKVISIDKGVGKFSLTLQDLAPGKLYYIKSFAMNSKGTAYSLETSFTTGVTLPAVTTTSVSSITSSSAKSGGNVSADGGSAVTARGVVWAETSMPTIEANKTTDGSGLGSFASAMSSLKPGTKYYVRAYATTVAGTAYGDELTFTTSIALPVVVTANVTDITHNSAKGGGSITSDGGSEITAKGIVWSTSQNPTVSLATKTTEGTGVSAFNSEITGLTPGAIYYVRAYATNAKGTAYGAQVTFKANSFLASITTSPVSSITSFSAKCGGNITFDGGAAVTSRGVVWSTNHNPTVSLSTKTSDGTGTGSFSSTISGLEPGRTYYVRAYASNAFDTAYGDELTFTTLIALPVVVTSSSTDITFESAKCGGAITSDGGSEITAKGVVWSTSQTPTVSLSTKTNNGTGTSAFTSQIIGLAPGVTYYVRAYATNAKGTSYGDQVSFSTVKYVDLGLSVKWAIYNLGASSLEEYGGLYQWAGTEDVSNKSIYLGWDNCPYHIGLDQETGWTKYFPIYGESYWSGSGAPDGKMFLDLEDDAAYVTLGGNWRMPTNDEWQELIRNCSWTWTVINGVKGYKVQSKMLGYTDKWIFLPAAGCRDYDLRSRENDTGYYWSLTLDRTVSIGALYVELRSSGVYPYSHERYCGMSVRPVLANPSRVAGFYLDRDFLSIRVGETVRIKATVFPETASNKRVVWNSNNSSCVEVDDMGNVTGISYGGATIEAKTEDGKYVESISVGVNF